MSRICFISALSISIALIGGALWFRFGKVEYVPQNIVVLENIDTLTSEDSSLADFKLSTTTGSNEPLTSTDQLSRQLFSDFITLKSQDQVTSSNIDVIATKYAESISSADISSIPVNAVNINQIVVVSDTEENFASYGAAIINIRAKYKNLVASLSGESTNLTDPESGAFYVFMGEAGKLYQVAAKELISIRTPVSLSSNHMSLINSYLKSAGLMELISNTPQDPLKAYPALNTYIQSSGEESALLLNIQQILQAYGITFSSDA